MSTYSWLILGAAAVGAGFLLPSLRGLPRKRGMWALARARTAVSRQEFASHFADPRISPQILNVVCQMVQRELAGIKDFPVLPTDDLRELYGASEDILDCLLEELLTDCGKQVGLTDLRWSSGEVRTVADLIRFVASCPKAP